MVSRKSSSASDRSTSKVRDATTVSGTIPLRVDQYGFDAAERSCPINSDKPVFLKTTTERTVDEHQVGLKSRGRLAQVGHRTPLRRQHRWKESGVVDAWGRLENTDHILRKLLGGDGQPFGPARPHLHAGRHQGNATQRGRCVAVVQDALDRPRKGLRICSMGVSSRWRGADAHVPRARVSPRLSPKCRSPRSGTWRARCEIRRASRRVMLRVRFRLGPRN